LDDLARAALLAIAATTGTQIAAQASVCRAKSHLDGKKAARA